MLRKYLISTEPGRMRRCKVFRRLWASRASGLQRDEQHHVVVDRRSTVLVLEAVPARNFETLAVLAAAEEAHVAEIFERRPVSTVHRDALAVRALDLLVRHLDEIGALEHGGQRLDQLRIGAIDRLGR